MTTVANKTFSYKLLGFSFNSITYNCSIDLGLYDGATLIAQETIAVSKEDVLVLLAGNSSFANSFGVIASVIETTAVSKVTRI